MLMLLKIGYTTLLLPNDKGLQTVLRTLATARKVEDDLRYKEGPIKLGENIVVSVEMLPGYKLGPSSRGAVETVTPEVLPPENNQLKGRTQYPELSGRRARMLLHN